MKEFDKIIGYKNVKIELERICDIMVNAEKYHKLGVSSPKGLLLYGNPGVGKTLMSKCILEASGSKYFVLRKNIPDGDFVKEIKKTFEKAKECAPSIVFLDDMDKFANSDIYHRNTDEFVTIQACIDDCKGIEVFILATANDLHCVPDSLIRAGRFDKLIEIENPKGNDAVEIIKHYLEDKKFVADVNASDIAKVLDGGSCADLETVINEAGIYAGFENKDKIEMNDIVRAAMRTVFNAPENLDETDEEELLAIAYHEAGHAVIAEVLEPSSVSIVSVLSHIGNTGGVTAYNQPDKYFQHKKYMENRVVSLLGGKAATEIIYGEVDTGSNSDLHRAFDIVERFVDNYCSTGFDCFEQCSNTSDALLARRDVHIAAEMEKYYAEAKKILINNRLFLDELAHTLVSKKTILSKDILQIKNNCGIKSAA